MKASRMSGRAALANRAQPLSCSELLNALVDPGSDNHPPRPLPEHNQQHAEDLMVVLTDLGFVAMLQGRELITAVRLALGHRMAEAVLQEHGTLRVVLPSAAEGITLPEPAWLAEFHAQKLQAGTHMHLACCEYNPCKDMDPFSFYSVIKAVFRGLSTAPDTRYLTSYTSALHSVLSAAGITGRAATSLHIDMGRADVPDTLYSQEHTALAPGVVDALSVLTQLLPRLQSVSIIGGKALKVQNEQRIINCLRCCPQLHTLHLATRGMASDGFAAASNYTTSMVYACECLEWLRMFACNHSSQPGHQLKHGQALQALSCRRLWHSPYIWPHMHTLSAPPSPPCSRPGTSAKAGASTAGSSSSSTPPSLQGSAFWHPQRPPCSMNVWHLAAFPALQQLQDMELGLAYPMPNPSSQAQQLLVTLLEGRLASCAQGWALVFDVDLSLPEDEAFPWSGRLPLGGLPAVQNVVLHIVVYNPLGQLPAYAVEGLQELVAALPGMRQLLIEPCPFYEDAEPTADMLDQYLPCMVHAASIAYSSSWHGRVAIHKEARRQLELKWQGQLQGQAGGAACTQCTWQLMTNDHSRCQISSSQQRVLQSHQPCIA